MKLFILLKLNKWKEMERAAIQPEATNLTLRIEMEYLDIEEGSRKKRSKEKTIFYYFFTRCLWSPSISGPNLAIFA